MFYYKTMLPRYKNLDPKWTQYARDVIAGNIIAGNYIQLACHRYLRWFDREDIFFDEEKMEKIEDLIGHMRHFEGRFANKPFLLLPFQRWILASIFAWYYVDEPDKRVVEECLLFIARKNAKTALSAAIILSDMIVNKSPGYEGYLIAQTREQARIALKFIKGYVKSLDRGRKKHFKIYKDRVEYIKTGGFVSVSSSEAGVSDGGNPDLALLDEQHASKDDSMRQVMKSGMAMKPNALTITISSGGYLMDGFPFYERVQTAQRILRGELEDTDSNFYALYEMDPDDDWTSPDNWIKSNPSLGEIVQMKYMLGRLHEAKTDMATQVDFKIKNLDKFVTARNIWLIPENLDKVCTKLDMERLKGEMCYAGCDLSSVNDLASIALCWPPNEYRDYYPDKYLFKVFTWVPQAALETSNGTFYEQFIHLGILKMTSGNSVDYEEILKDLCELNNEYPIVKFLYDEWNATSFIQKLTSLNVI